MFPKQTEGTVPLEGHVTQRCVQGPDALHVNVTASVTPTDIQIQQRALACTTADARVHQSRKSSPSFQNKCFQSHVAVARKTLKRYDRKGDWRDEKPSCQRRMTGMVPANKKATATHYSQDLWTNSVLNLQADGLQQQKTQEPQKDQRLCQIH